MAEVKPNHALLGWIGVDLDGTLAYYDHWRGLEHIGKPIRPMVDRVQRWLGQGKDVRIFTARVACDEPERSLVIGYIGAWCERYLGQCLPVTNQKDMQMVECWDDRAVRVMTNEGNPLPATPE